MSGHSKVPEEEVITEELDPRIPVELERLNNLSTEINQLESKMDEAHENFRLLLSQSSTQLKLLAMDIGHKSIEKARPYYDALIKAREAQKQTQMAAIEYQRANGIHSAAKETIKLAEAKFDEIAIKETEMTSRFDAAWQEMLNHATLKVNESEALKLESEQRHKQTAADFTLIDKFVTYLEKTLSKSLLVKTRPYFEAKEKYNSALEEQKDKITKLQNDISLRKEAYRGSLKTLEHISETIHKQRMFEMTHLNASQGPHFDGELLRSAEKPVHSFKYPLIKDGSEVFDLGNSALSDTNDFFTSGRKQARSFVIHSTPDPDNNNVEGDTKRRSLEQLDREIQKATKSYLISSSPHKFFNKSRESSSSEPEPPDVLVIHKDVVVLPDNSNFNLDEKEFTESDEPPSSASIKDDYDLIKDGYMISQDSQGIHIKLDQTLTENEMNRLIKNIENLSFKNVESLSDANPSNNFNQEQTFRQRSNTNVGIENVNKTNIEEEPDLKIGKNNNAISSEVIMTPCNLKFDYPA